MFTSTYKKTTYHNIAFHGGQKRGPIVLCYRVTGNTVSDSKDCCLSLSTHHRIKEDDVTLDFQAPAIKLQVMGIVIQKSQQIHVMNTIGSSGYVY